MFTTAAAKATCPHCKQEVDPAASRCPHCHGKIYRWTRSRKILAATLGGAILLAFITSAVNDDSPSPSRPSVQQVAISEAQCESLKAEYYSVIADEEAHALPQLAKEVLEQYLYAEGIPVKRSNPGVHYVLPSSECGELVETSLVVIVEGQKRALSR